MNNFLRLYRKRDALGFPSRELVIREAIKLNLTYQKAKKALKRALWKSVK